MCLIDAGIVLQGRVGERTVPATEFFLSPFTTTLAGDEIILGIDVPCFSPGARWAYRKTCRKPGEFAAAIGAVWIDPGRGVARALIGALDRMPQLVSGVAELAALRQPGGLSSMLDDAGVADPYEREVHAAMLRRALQDIASP